MTSKKCKLKLLYEADDFPIFQNRMYDSLEESMACPRGDIRLVENLETGLVYNESFQPELLVYGTEYQNEQAVSPHFTAHLQFVGEVVDKAMGRNKLVEVGCGKGYFLEMLLKNGFDVVGFDPAYEGNNPRIQKNTFEPSEKFEAKGIVLRHVLEHVQDPFTFLSKIKNANGGAGLIYIEVPCFDWICRRRAWFDVYYEHVNYFRLADFFSMFGTIVDSGKLFGDQYIYVIAQLASLRKPTTNQNSRISFPTDFLAKLSEKQVPEKAVVWGGASKGVIFSLLKSRIGQTVDHVIDINPAKQGKFTPATGLQVFSPKDGLARMPVDATIYVMNSNYLMEIKEMSGNVFNYVVVDDE